MIIHISNRQASSYNIDVVTDFYAKLVENLDNGEYESLDEFKNRLSPDSICEPFSPITDLLAIYDDNEEVILLENGIKSLRRRLIAGCYLETYAISNSTLLAYLFVDAKCRGRNLARTLLTIAQQIAVDNSKFRASIWWSQLASKIGKLLSKCPAFVDLDEEDCNQLAQESMEESIDFQYKFKQQEQDLSNSSSNCSISSASYTSLSSSSTSSSDEPAITTSVSSMTTKCNKYLHELLQLPTVLLLECDIIGASSEHMNPQARQEVYKKLGFKALKIPFVQPPLVSLAATFSTSAGSYAQPSNSSLVNHEEEITPSSPKDFAEKMFGALPKTPVTPTGAPMQMSFPTSAAGSGIPMLLLCHSAFAVPCKRALIAFVWEYYTASAHLKPGTFIALCRELSKLGYQANQSMDASSDDDEEMGNSSALYANSIINTTPVPTLELPVYEKITI